MITVKQVLDGKGHDVLSINADASVYDAIKVMADKEVGSLLVTDGGKPVGLISERDYARKVILQGRSSKQTAIREIMAARVPVAHPGQDIEECMAIMTERRVRHLPVVEGDDVVGIISIGDLVKAVIADQQFIIEQLERYITG
jgi:CBS domain-containing protein